MNKYICYTDGAYKESIGSGGWASIICDENEKILKRLYSGLKNTSNNRMELLAVLETLKFFKEPSHLIIISDSMYVVNSISNNWVKKWFETQDYSKSNLDLWFQVLELLDKHTVEMRWVKGHAGNSINEEADKWAQFASQCLNLPKDEYFNKS